MAKGTLPFPTAELIGTFLEAIFYGIYLVIFPQCIGILLKRRKDGGRLVKCFLGVMAFSFILITMHLCVDLTRAFAAFTANMDVPGSPDKYYANVDSTLNIMKTATYSTTTVISDAVLLFRAWIVWGRNYFIVTVPILLWFADILRISSLLNCTIDGNVATAAWFTWSTNVAKPGASVLISAVFARSKYFYVVTLILNLLGSVLIAFRLWSVRRRVSRHTFGRVPNVISIVVESAAIYSVLLIVMIATSVADESAHFFFLNSMAPVVGSVFSYVILRSSGDASTEYEAAIKGIRTSMRFRRTSKTQAASVELYLEQIVRADEENPPFSPEEDHSPIKRSPADF
ncbi:unnamed protein product [Somion occarium]|uniref:Uncharacterized protein n=1 Tax=Somion occarium TaxID=3059160 RepID=A0ABP1DI06_9APHY